MLPSVESGPLTVASLAALLEEKGSSALVERVGGWVLVGPAPIDEHPDEWSYRTLSARTVRFVFDNSEGFLKENFLAFGLTKPANRSFANTLLIGRSRSNDVCLPHSGVSKLHARIRVASDDELWLSDAGSSNGTAADGVQLIGDAETRLRHGTRIRFGAMTLQVLTTRELEPVLRRLKPE